MNIFPTSYYQFKLIDDEIKTLERLERRTEISNSLISAKTEKSFIGTINRNQFQIISSEIGVGAFCVLNGKIEKDKGNIKVEINKPFKIIFSLFFLFPLIGLIFQCVKNQEITHILIMILVAVLQILIIRFLMLELIYRILSKKSINKLKDVLDVEWINKVGKYC